MASNFEKRKIKEQQKQTEVQTVLDRTAVDVTSIGNDQFVFVEVKYNLETGEAVVERSQPTSRAVGLGFEVKKRALQNINKI